MLLAKSYLFIGEYFFPRADLALVKGMGAAKE